ncbi:MAG: exodeoxyribonuclease VII small subunit [Chloroflexi bacterium]|nr:exodeoxyribonuclease VII small subunit [Chloroflexota bacterium]
MPKRKNDNDANLNGMSFEQALARLDETVKALEQGGLPLAEAARLFEEGMRLARVCSETLAAAELRISRVQTAYGEQMRMMPDDEEEKTGSC